MMATEKEKAQYFDVLHSSKDYAAEVAFLDKAFLKYAKRKVARVLVVGCRSGGHLGSLRANYTVFCLDSDPELLSLAKAKHKDVDFFSENFSDFSLDRTFDAVICPFSVFSLCTTEEEVRGFLSSCSAHLEKGGVLIFDYLRPHEKHTVWGQSAHTGEILDPHSHR